MFKIYKHTHILYINGQLKQTCLCLGISRACMYTCIPQVYRTKLECGYCRWDNTKINVSKPRPLHLFEAGLLYTCIVLIYQRGNDSLGWLWMIGAYLESLVCEQGVGASSQERSRVWHSIGRLGRHAAVSYTQLTYHTAPRWAKTPGGTWSHLPEGTPSYYNKRIHVQKSTAPPY